MNHEHAHHKSCCADKSSAPAAAQYIDPVCGMMVGADSPHRSQYGGHDHRFCSSGCREKFDANPARYTEPRPATTTSAHEGHPAPAPTAAAPPGTIYTCPMHPQIRQSG